LERREVERLFSKATLVKAEPGLRIVSMGYPSDALFILRSGLAEATCAGMSGAPVRCFRPGDFFGGTGVLSGEEWRFTNVLVREPSEVVVLPGDSLLRFLA
jgi:CRP-like cAMP-binding protein